MYLSRSAKALSSDTANAGLVFTELRKSLRLMASREQAVSAYTVGSAFAEFQEKQKGQLAVGMLADLAVLSADLFSVPVAELQSLRSVLTMLGGKIVHDAGAIH